MSCPLPSLFYSPPSSQSCEQIPQLDGNVTSLNSSVSSDDSSVDSNNSSVNSDDQVDPVPDPAVFVVDNNGKLSLSPSTPVPEEELFWSSSE